MEFPMIPKLSELAVDFQGEDGKFFLGFVAVFLLWELDAVGFLPLERKP